MVSLTGLKDMKRYILVIKKYMSVYFMEVLFHKLYNYNAQSFFLTYRKLYKGVIIKIKILKRKMEI